MNQLYKPFNITIQGRDANNILYEIPENLNIKLLAPADPFWQEGAEDEPDNNIHRNKGTCNFRLYTTDQNGNNETNWLAEFNINETGENDENEYWNISYNEDYFTVDGIPLSNCELNISSSGELRCLLNSVSYTWFSLRAEEDTGIIRPGDDILLRFALLDHPEITPATADMGDFFAVYDKKLLWRAQLYIDEGAANDWNNVNPWDNSDNNNWYLSQDNGADVNGGQIDIVPWTRFNNGTIVTTAVAYSWGCADSVYDFNADMEEQRAALSAYYSDGTNNNPDPANNEQIGDNPDPSEHRDWSPWVETYAPGTGTDRWHNYLKGIYDEDAQTYQSITINGTAHHPYLPSFSSYKRSIGTYHDYDTKRSAGVECAGFVQRCASYAVNQYIVPDITTRTIWGGGMPALVALSSYSWTISDLNLINIGDIIGCDGHVGIVWKIIYSDDSRVISPGDVIIIESTGADYMVRKDRTLEYWESEPDWFPNITYYRFETN